jgi:putative methyltransferase (TIGR04325 family)
MRALVLIKRRLGKFWHSKSCDRIVFDGNYPDWKSALKKCEGYESSHILEKVLAASLKVKNGEECFERDSVNFSSIQYSWPVLSGIMTAALMSDGYLSVLDFGGALGSSYYQNKKFLKLVPNANWSIVEQPSFVRAGKSFIQEEGLNFYESISDCIKEKKPNIFLLSSVLQYIDNPTEILQEIFNANPKVIILDRTSFVLNQNVQRIAIQTVPQHLYKASYPCHFFVESQLISLFEECGYCLLERFTASDQGLDESGAWLGHIFIQSEHGF